MECNICGGNEFVARTKRPNTRCGQCGSLERTRIIALFIDKLGLLEPDTRVLHLAPERGLARRLRAVAGDNVTLADLNPERYRGQTGVVSLDLCADLDGIPSRSYDLIVHSHVLEHLPCNHAYVLFHLHRVLADTGRIVCSIPVMGGYYDFATSPALSEDERHRRFGQHNHVARYGREDLHMSLGKFYDLGDYDLTRHFDVDDLRRYNIPERIWRGFSPSSVLCLSRLDYRLMLPD